MARGTTLRNFRADDELWQRAKKAAERRKESLSDVLRRSLEEYVEKYG